MDISTSIPVVTGASRGLGRHLVSALLERGITVHGVYPAANARWARLHEVLTDDFVIVEPASLPYGGEHHGVDGYVALMQRISELFALEFEPEGIHALDDSSVLLHMHVAFTARATGRACRLPVLELLTIRDGRVARSEVFLFDTATLLTLLL